jgi:hypothetical protein
VIRRRQDGAFVAAFSAIGAIREGIAEAAKEDYGRLIQSNADLLGLRGDGDRATISCSRQATVVGAIGALSAAFGAIHP